MKIQAAFSSLFVPSPSLSGSVLHIFSREKDLDSDISSGSGVRRPGLSFSFPSGILSSVEGMKHEALTSTQFW